MMWHGLAGKLDVALRSPFSFTVCVLWIRVWPPKKAFAAPAPTHPRRQQKLELAYDFACHPCVGAMLLVCNHL